MDPTLRRDADAIVRAALAAVGPEEAVRQAVTGLTFPGRVFLVAVGKAAWRMAQAALACLRTPLSDGIVITKYGHAAGDLPGVRCFEAGHPVPDQNSLAATEAALRMTERLLPTDTVLFLLSGGGSALFEQPLVPLDTLADVTNQLLHSGAEIVDVNRIRKRLSGVKGGRFARHCLPARVEAVVLSDILGDPLDMIASGPVSPDSSTCDEAIAAAERYGLRLPADVWALLRTETPKQLSNVRAQVVGSVRALCAAAEAACRALGYAPVFLTDRLCCEAREAGSFLASVLSSHADSPASLAFLAGGETVVHVTGSGLGGRNQELALAAAPGIAGLRGAAVFSVGSDGTDGPTDAAGGYVDYQTCSALRAQGIALCAALQKNDAYHALQAVDGLLVTGPTGTNVNDVAVALLRRAQDAQPAASGRSQL